MCINLILYDVILCLESVRASGINVRMYTFTVVYPVYVIRLLVQGRVNSI